MVTQTASQLDEYDEEDGESEEEEEEEYKPEPNKAAKLWLRRKLPVDKKLSAVVEMCSEDGTPMVSLVRKKNMGGRAVSRCLVANDSCFLLYTVERQLSPFFNILHTFENGKEALNAVKSQPRDYYAAIVLDISMPVMDGIEACGLI